MALPLGYLEVARAEEDDPTKVHVVRIACEGEVRELDVPKFQSTTLPIHDSLFSGDDDGAVSDLSRFLGIPIVARRAPVDSYWDMDMTNIEASSLFRNCDISTRNSVSSTTSGSKIMLPFGVIPVQWALDVGPVLVARLDCKPLHPLHAAAIAAFCSRHIRVAFQECIDAERSLTSSPLPLPPPAATHVRTPSSGGSSSSALASSSSATTGLPSQSMATTMMMNTAGDAAAMTAAVAATYSETIYERRRAVLALATSGSFAQFFEQYKARRLLGQPDLYGIGNAELDHLRNVGRWSIPMDEIESRPEWEDVPSPFDV